MSAERVRPGDRLVVFGAGGHARSVGDAITRIGAAVLAMVEDDDEGIALAAHATGAVIAIGDAGTRLAVMQRLTASGVTVLSVVATTATLATDAALGVGSVVLEHAHVGPGSRLGDACIVNTRASVDHDCVLGDGVHVAPGAVLAGGVTCGPRALIGTGASIIPGVDIGAQAIVGAGAAVTADVPCGCVAVGVPARSRRRRSES